MKLSRRSVLGLCCGAAASTVFSTLGASLARAEDNDHRLLVVRFVGGWDQLLGLDPRSLTDFPTAGDGIQPAYDLARPSNDWMEQTGDGITTRGKLTFGPAVPKELHDHYQDLAIIRGVNMNTLTHEVGAHYFTTGIFPRGLTPVGNSLTSNIAEKLGSNELLPNLSMRTESFYNGANAYASPIEVADSTAMQDLLVSLGAPLSAGNDAIADYENRPADCRRTELDGHGLAAMFVDGRKRAREMVTSGKSELFKFTTKSPIIEALKGGPATAADLKGSIGRAAVAAQALSSGLSRAVSVQLCQDLDTHFDWADTHPELLHDGFGLLGRLIQLLKDTNLEGTSQSMWSKTTLLVFSEFSRTPRLNGRDGRDHHLSSSCLVAGPGIAGNQVIGKTSNDATMVAEKYDFGDGAGPSPMRPVDIHKTLIESMGVTDIDLGTQQPKIIEKLIA